MEQSRRYLRSTPMLDFEDSAIARWIDALG